MVECRGLYKLLRGESDALVAREEIFFLLESSDVVETLMVGTETWKKFESKTRDQDLKKFSRPRSRLGEFFETETRLRDPRF